LPDQLTSADRAAGALWGLFLGDALAMPVHWYYDRQALFNDYGEVRDLMAPLPRHSGSILHRSHYEPLNEDADILHDQAQYWGQRDVHYHQHLQAGENTLNLQLAQLLLDQVDEQGVYSSDLFLQEMIAFLRNPDSHRDTYVEEWARGFFTRRAQGLSLSRCAVEEKHIGGLVGATALLIAYHAEPDTGRVLAHEHLQLTHRGTHMAKALEAVADILQPVLAGKDLVQSVDQARRKNGNRFLTFDFAGYARRDDLEVVGRVLSTACYVEEAVPAVFYLARKYAHQAEKALVTNTMAGGDNCHRGAILGALLGAQCGPEGWPLRWRQNLLYHPSLPLDAP
jgi:ADP-ribosylglycohydrolase